MELKDRVAIVTGASLGIGRAIALDLAQNGASGAVSGCIPAIQPLASCDFLPAANLGSRCV